MVERYGWVCVNLARLVDICIFTRDVPWALLILFFVGTSVWTISGRHRCAGWCPLAWWDEKTFPWKKKKKRESRGSSGGRVSILGCSEGVQAVTFFFRWTFSSDSLRVGFTCGNYVESKMGSSFLPSFSQGSAYFELILLCQLLISSLLEAKGSSNLMLT